MKKQNKFLLFAGITAMICLCLFAKCTDEEDFSTNTSAPAKILKDDKLVLNGTDTLQVTAKTDDRIEKNHGNIPDDPSLIPDPPKIYTYHEYIIGSWEVEEQFRTDFSSDTLVFTGDSLYTYSNCYSGHYDGVYYRVKNDTIEVPHENFPSFYMFITDTISHDEMILFGYGPCSYRTLQQMYFVHFYRMK
ncbi:MAG: hypothetical protein J6P44_03905 [Bacteroidales bacterium]|nr:hypothetical protein [Bacteroidales bacterium]